MIRRRFCVALAALSLLSVAACQDPVATTPVPLAPASIAGTNALAAPDSDSYIVLFAPSPANVDNHAAEVARAHGGKLSRVYHTAVRGFAGHFSPAAAAAIARRPDVTLIERDRSMHITGTQTNATVGTRPCRPARATTERHVRLYGDGRRRERRTSSIPGSARRTRSSAAGRPATSTPSTTATEPATATATALTCRERSEARRTASRSR